MKTREIVVLSSYLCFKRLAATALDEQAQCKSRRTAGLPCVLDKIEDSGKMAVSAPGLGAVAQVS